MEPVKCGNCDKELNVSMEIEYSRTINEFFCNPNCAKDRYFSYMDSSVFDKDDETLLQEEDLKIIDGKLIHKDW
ncbi:hypothetical protein FHE72_23615 (plasmid) [Rossellomorea vietnamensis]|uniref:Uncharacterized protein n=1 Tax=Rossellomorea vietnamensis TaxID=218284 RepID=A0A6I6UX90_9BACI|nr:hypothetical protein [Rossellomorea vietnamensis]QHE63982.1 hypothetical protein FHE72_23615 [Rossellomorea vietnamensis]